MRRLSCGAGIITLLAILLLAVGCGNPFAPKPYKETQFMMDTVIEITAYGPKAEPAVKAAFAEFRKYQDLSDRFNPDSQVAEINRMAGKQAVQADPVLIRMVLDSKAAAAKLGGLFDISVGALTELWGVGHKGEFIPSEEEIKRTLTLVDYRLVLVDEGKGTIYLAREGMAIDLGGIAKGYATDRAVEVLKAQGVTSALINAGGNVRVIGNRPDGKAWRVGVQHPRNSDGVAAKLALTDWDTMETSGDYQRYFLKDGIRYSHILDPRTGRQPRTVASVTMVSKDSTDGEFLGKALFILGPDKGRELLRQFPGNEAIFIDLDGKVTFTDGLKGKIEL